MAAIGLQMLLPAFGQELVEIGMRMDARMDVAIDDAQPRRGGLFLFEDWTVDDITHACLLMSRVSIAERFQADCRRTCARPNSSADSVASDRRPRTASADSRTQTKTSFSRRSGR